MLEALLRRTADTLAELPKEILTSEDEMLPAGTSRAYGAVGIASLCEQELHHHHDVDGAWLVQGAYIEKIVKMTQSKYYDAVMRFQRIMQATRASPIRCEPRASR